METTNAAQTYAARLASWETAWGAYIDSDRSADAWAALDAACVAIGETNPIPAPAAFIPHRKPAQGVACAVCGCAAKSLRTALHARSMPRERLSSTYTKRVQTPHGLDANWVAI